MQSALAGPHESTYSGYCSRQCLLSREADRTVTHMPDHDRGLDLEVGCELCQKINVTVGMLSDG